MFTKTNTLGVYVCLLSAVAVSGPAASAQVTNFDGGGDGTNWTDPLNWDNGEPNGLSFDAVIDGASGSPFDVQIDTSRVVDTVTIGDEDILRLLNAKNLEVGSQIDNVGTFRLVSTVSATILQIENAVDLIGGGSILMEGAAARIADSLGAADTGQLTNVNNTISGRGSIGQNRTQLTNNGTIRANFGGAQLIIDPGAGNMVNDGLMEATQLATLRLDNGTYNNLGGTIRAQADSFVQLFGGPTIINGTLETVGTGIIETGNATAAVLDNVTLNGLLRINNTDNLELIGTLTDNASSIIRIDSTVSSTDLIIEGAVTLTGGGTVEMVTSAARILDVGGLADTGHLINSDHLIKGQGNIGFNRTQITNHGTIRADITGTTLDIDPGTGGLLNDSLLEADNGATLRLTAGAYTNTLGTIRAQTASIVELTSGPTITNGTLQTIGTGVIQTGNATNVVLNDVTLDGLLRINNTDNIELTGTFTDNATSVIRIDSTVSVTDLLIEGPVTLTGGGTIKMAGSGARILDETGDVLGHLINNDHLIQGRGGIGVNRTQITNHGTIQADVSGQVLVLDPDLRGLLNDSLMEATNGATLQLNAGVYTNTLGTIRAQTGSIVELTSGPTITNGTLQTVGTGVIQTGNATNVVLNDVTLDGLLRINNTDNIELTGTFTDNATSVIRIDSTVSVTDLLIEGPVTLTGGGTVEMVSTGARILDETGAADGHLTNNDHLIHGQGNIGGNRTQITNHGTIRADVIATTLVVDPDTDGLVNTNLIESTNGASLQLNAGGYTNTGGTIKAGNDSFVRFVGGPSITGGTLQSIGTGRFETGDAAVTKLDGVTIDGLVVIDNTDNLELIGSINNTPGSVIRIDSTVSPTDLLIDGTVTLNGGGAIEMLGASPRILDESGAILGHLINTDNFMHGRGNIGGNRTQVSNGGTIAADIAATTLTIDVDARGLVNLGTLRAENTATLHIIDGFANDGDIVAAVDSTVRIDGTLTNNASGVISGNGHIKMGNTGVVDILNDGEITPGASPGGLSMDVGTLTMGATATLTTEIGGLTAGTDYDRLTVFGDVVLGGTLDASIFGGFTPSIGDSFEILLASGSVTGTFDTVNLPAGPGEGFNLVYGSNFVRLTVLRIQGDLNGDGFVGIEDLNIVLSNWNATVTAGNVSMGDPSGDGFVGIEDLNNVLGNWNGGTGFPASPTPPVVGAAVPEPTTAGLLMLGVGLITNRRRR